MGILQFISRAKLPLNYAIRQRMTEQNALLFWDTLPRFASLDKLYSQGKSHGAGREASQKAPVAVQIRERKTRRVK